MDSKKIVVVQKDKIIKSILELFVEQLNHEVYGSFFTFEECLAFVEQNTPELVLIDLNIFENIVDTSTVVEQMKRFTCPIVFMGNPSDIDIGKEMINFNLYAFMSKPIKQEILQINIDLALAKLGKEEENERFFCEKKCQVMCTVDAKGKILEWNTPFNDAFKIEGSEKRLLSDVFQDNLEFAKFPETIKDLGADVAKTSVFSHKSSIYSSRITKMEDETFKICFRKAKMNEILTFHEALNQTKFASIHQNTSSGVLIFRANGTLAQFNKKAEDIFRNLFDMELLNHMDINQVLSVIPKFSTEDLLKNIYLPSIFSLERVIHKNKTKTVLNIELKAAVSEIEKSIGNVFVNITDVSESKMLKEEVRQLKENMNPFINNTIQRLFLVDLNKKLVAFNNAAAQNIEKKFQRTLKINDDLRDLITNSEKREFFDNAFKKARSGENVVYKIKTEIDGELLWDEVHYNPIQNVNGDIDKVLIWSLDITETERHLAELTEKESRYELIAKRSSDGLWDWNLETNELHISEEWKKFLGYTEEDVLNRFGTLENLVHPNDRQTNREAIEKCLKDGTNVFQDEIRILSRNNQYKWVLERGVILRREDGKPYRIAGAITDIGEQKEKELVISQINQALLEERNLFNKGKIGVLRVDAQNRTDVKYISESSINLTGYTPQEFYDKKVMVRDLIHPEDREKRLSEGREAIKNNQTEVRFSDYRIIKKNGDVVWLKDYANVLRDEDGHVIEILSCIMDVTKVKNIYKNHQELQSIFSSLWGFIQQEAIVVDYKGKILYANNDEDLPLKNITDKELFIFDYFKGLPDWNQILSDINEYQKNISYIINLDAKILEVRINQIDEKKLLVLGSRIDS